MTPVKQDSVAKFGGWIPDLPDDRDYTLLNSCDRLYAAVCATHCVDPEFDLSDHFPPVDDQGETMATTAVSCGSLIEYFNRRFRGRLSRVSKKFLYDVSRRMHGIEGDNGVSIRQALKAIVRVGVPPEAYARSSAGSSLDLSLDPLLYSFASDYQDLQYVRVGPIENKSCLDVIQSLLHLGLPCVFGMPIFTTLTSDARLDYRGVMDEVSGGATGIFVGYSDEYRVSDCGALKFRSSWGPGWGESGYGWITYRLITEGTIRDVWTLFSPRWLDRGDLPIA